MDNPFEQRRDIRGTKTYWKLRGLVRELLESESECLVCGSRNDLEAHHVIKCANHEYLYVERDNLVCLCHKCHSRYHQQNPDSVNIKTLVEFAKKNK